MIITVDGPAGAGKGTVAHAIANYFGFKAIDSGLLYRALALKALEEKVGLDAVDSLLNLTSVLTEKDLKSPLLRQETTGNAASKIAVYQCVRDALNARLRHMCNEIHAPYHGVVVDGRDMGTVLFPLAPFKFYITADIEVRAHRRYNELLQTKGVAFVAHNFVEQLIERDRRDSQRTISPLMPASDALIIDTTHMSIQDSCQAVIDYLIPHLTPTATQVPAGLGR